MTIEEDYVGDNCLRLKGSYQSPVGARALNMKRGTPRSAGGSQSKSVAEMDPVQLPALPHFVKEARLCGRPADRAEEA